MDRYSRWPHTQGIRALGITYGLGSNTGKLICSPEFLEPGQIQSLITNWCQIDPVPYGPDLDAYCHILDDPAHPFRIAHDDRELFVQGDLSRLDRAGQDRRWSLLGNIGLFFRYALSVQERHGIYSLHASAIYKPDEHELLLVVGKAGAGKTVFLLEALARGYQIFSTEMTYFRLVAQGIAFYRGAVMDNVRVATLYDFPEACERLGLALPEVQDPWEVKVSINMASAATAAEMLHNPTLSFVFPRIEAGITRAVVRDVASPRTLLRLLFDSASEKIGSTILLYEELPALSFDSQELAHHRWLAIERLVAAPNWTLKQARTTLAGPEVCLEGID